MHDANPSSFGLRRVFRLARKELREILRDRRTILTLVAMPILLYPLMSVVFLQFTLASKPAKEVSPVYEIGFVTAAEQSAFDLRFRRGQKALNKAGLKSAYPPTVVPYRAPEIAGGRADRMEVLLTWLRGKEIDLIVAIPGVDPDEIDARSDSPPGRILPCQIIAMPDNSEGQAAMRLISVVFAAADAQDLSDRLMAPGVSALPELAAAVCGAAPAVSPHNQALSVRSVVLPGKDGMISLAALVPLILILMTITGAVYPAIDLTAGERERGTLEILVAAPVPRFELLTAKYLSVLSVAVLTALVNLVCMALTLSWSGMATTLFGAGGVSLGLLLQVLALLLLFAGFFSAVLLCLTSFARSFKEAQAYLIPLMLASLAPGVMAMLPGLKLEGVLTVLPLVNIVLMARDLFEGTVEVGTATIVVMTTLLYALAALGLAARVFGAESVLFSEQSSWADLLRRPETPQPCLTLSAALWCLALMVPIQFSLFALVRALGPAMSAGFTIFAGVVVNLLLFGALPGLFAYLGRLDVRAALGLQTPRPAALLAGVLLGCSLWPLQLWLMSESGISQVLQERFGEVLQSLRNAREDAGLGVFALVIVPAILEEIFFRGLLWSALRSRCGALLTIGVSGLLFGATHVILDGALGLERLVPSTLLGLILGLVCWRSGCLWPSLIQHVLHNTILLAVGLGESGDTTHIPWQWLAGAAVGTVIAAGLLGFWGERTPDMGGQV